VPAKVLPHAAIRARLATSIAEALELSERLEPLIAEKSRQPSGTFHGKVDHSQPPWCVPVAYAITGLHALARRMESELRDDLDFTPLERGGSDANTREAFKAVMRLAESADDFIIRSYNRELDKWWKTAKIALDEIDIPKRIPRAPGKAEPPCPFCKNHTLRVKILENEIFCINPACPGDGQGKKPKAYMDYSDVVGGWVVRWSDGIIMGEAA